MNLSSLPSYVVTLVTIVGLIVLIALNKVTAADGLPIIVALAGVHLGATISNSVSTPTATPIVTRQIPPVTPIQ